MHYWALLQLLLAGRHECGNKERLEEQGKDNTTLSNVRFVTPPLLLTWTIGRPTGTQWLKKLNLVRISMKTRGSSKSQKEAEQKFKISRHFPNLG